MHNVYVDYRTHNKVYVSDGVPDNGKNFVKAFRVCILRGSAASKIIWVLKLWHSKLRNVNHNELKPADLLQNKFRCQCSEIDWPVIQFIQFFPNSKYKNF